MVGKSTYDGSMDFGVPSKKTLYYGADISRLGEVTQDN